jgi:hypothetical protein
MTLPFFLAAFIHFLCQRVCLVWVTCFRVASYVVCPYKIIKITPKADRIRLTQTEQQTSIAKANTWGMSLNQYIRTLLILGQPPPPKRDVEQETHTKLCALYSRLSQPASRLKQLTKFATVQEQFPDDVDEELQELRRLAQEMEAVLLDLKSQLDRP